MLKSSIIKAFLFLIFSVAFSVTLASADGAKKTSTDESRPRPKKFETRSATTTLIREHTNAEKSSETNWFNLAISASATLLAAFFGVGFAFVLANLERKIKSEQKQYRQEIVRYLPSAVNGTLYY